MLHYQHLYLYGFLLGKNANKYFITQRDCTVGRDLGYLQCALGYFQRASRAVSGLTKLSSENPKLMNND